MIRALVDFALKSRWLVLGGVVVLTAWGVISFRNLPIEAYPDVANNYVQIITQWPGRSAEEIERQVTVPVEIQMAGIPHLAHLRSTTLAGLSSLMLVFDDDSTSDMNREHVLERLSQVNLPAGLTPQMGTDWSPVGQIYWYTLESTNPAYDVMEKKSLEDWSLEKSFKGVEGVVDVSSFGGPTKEYQIRLDPEKLVSYGLSISQVEQQIANNNTNGGGSFIEQGAQQINVQSRRPLHQRAGHREHRPQDRRMARPSTISDIATVEQGPKIRLGQIGRATAIRRQTAADHRQSRHGRRHRAAAEGRRLRSRASKAFTRRSSKLNDTHPAQGRQDRSLPRSLQVVSYTVETVEHNLTEGMFLVASFCSSSSATCAAPSSWRSPFPSRCCSPPSVSTSATFPPTCSRSARWTSAWSSMARWS